MFTKAHCENCQYLVRWAGIGSAKYDEVECHPPQGLGSLACIEEYRKRDINAEIICLREVRTSLG